jgi:hypothetical protein
MLEMEKISPDSGDVQGGGSARAVPFDMSLKGIHER